jgi:hypothetical protein
VRTSAALGMCRYLLSLPGYMGEDVSIGGGGTSVVQRQRYDSEWSGGTREHSDDVT